MAVVEGLIQKEGSSALNFGNYTLDKKSKVSDFEFNGDLYKVKTFREITKLERNGLFVYESVPGTAVNGYTASAQEVQFRIEGLEDAQITMELEPEVQYETFINDGSIGVMKTNLGGKLVFSVPLEEGSVSVVKIVRIG